MEAVAEAQDEQETAIIPRFNKENKPFEALLEDFIKFVAGKIAQFTSESNILGPYHFYNVVVGRGIGPNGKYYLNIANNYSEPNLHLWNFYNVESIDLIIHCMKKMKIKDDTNTIDYIDLEKDGGTRDIAFNDHAFDNVDITNMVSKYFNKSAFVFAYIFACIHCEFDKDIDIAVMFLFANASVLVKILEQNIEIDLFPTNTISVVCESKYIKALVEQTDLKPVGSYQQAIEKLTRMKENETFMLFIEEMIALDIFKNVRKSNQARPAIKCEEI